MKHNIILCTMFAMAFSLASCSDDDEETCENDDGICTVDVTVCCTQGQDECKYQVGDKEYDSIEEALMDSECSVAERAPDDERASVREGLKALTAKAKANL